jgi:hypothetical protein
VDCVASVAVAVMGRVSRVIVVLLWTVRREERESDRGHDNGGQDARYVRDT